MYGCESWTIKKAERRRTDAFELWCQRRLLRVPWTARRSNQSILKEIGPGISLEGMTLKLKLQYFGHLMRRVDSLENAGASRQSQSGPKNVHGTAEKEYYSKRILQQRWGREVQARLHKGKRSDHDFIQHLIFIQESKRKTRQLTFFLG